MKPFISILLLLSTLSPCVNAQDAHQHGHARLNLVIDGPLIDMELVSPSVNILGFEHEAHTEEEQEILRQAQNSLLLKGEPLFIFTADAECSPTEISLEAAEFDELHEDDSQLTEEHSDIHAHYVFRCNQPSKLAGMKTQLFNKFPGMDKLDVHVLTASMQVSRHMDKHHPELEF